jgi:hypothetical protein
MNNKTPDNGQGDSALEEYNRLQAIRTWNAGFRVPPVCTAYWTEDDFQKWLDSRKPLPPFEIWKESRHE